MESVPVRRSLYEKIENTLYGHYGERAPFIGAAIGGALGAAVGSAPIALGVGAALGITSFLFGFKMFDGIGIDPDDGHEVRIKRSLNEKLNNLYYGLDGQRAWFWGAVSRFDDSARESLANGLFSHMMHRKVLKGSAPAA